MVNNPLIRPYFLGGVALGGGPARIPMKWSPENLLIPSFCRFRTQRSRETTRNFEPQFLLRTSQVTDRDPITERQRMMVWGVQSPKQNAQYLGSMVHHSEVRWADWIPREKQRLFRVEFRASHTQPSTWANRKKKRCQSSLINSCLIFCWKILCKNWWSLAKGIRKLLRTKSGVLKG